MLNHVKKCFFIKRIVFKTLARNTYIEAFLGLVIMPGNNDINAFTLGQIYARIVIRFE